MKVIDFNSICPSLAKLDLRRRKLGMSRPVLARRSGVSIARVHAILRGTERNPRLSTIHALARALGVAVSVGAEGGIREVASAEEVRRERALEKAKHITAGVQGTMGLESQAVGQQTLDSLTEQIVHKLLAGSNRRLWAD
jgi:transcriptional regulator with XRE-family HTH domain